MVLAQNPADHEEAGEHLHHYEGKLQVYTEGTPAPLIGPTGYLMNRRFLPLAGLERGRNVSCGNVIRCRVNDSNTLPKLQGLEIQNAVKHCQRTHYRPPTPPRLIVAQGEYATWATTGEPTWKDGHKVSTLRGWLHPYAPVWESHGPVHQSRNIYHPGPNETAVLVAFHLAFLFRSPWEEPAAVQDWRKVGWVLKGSWPERLPQIERQGPNLWPSVSGFDTEFIPDTRKLIRWSLAWEERPGSPYQYSGLRVHVVEAPTEPYHERGYVTPPGSPVAVYSHNWIADLPHFYDVIGIRNATLEDTMYQHGVLYSDLEHTMDYVGSIYARINRWKHLEYINPIEYSAGDAVGALDGGKYMTSALLRDPLSDRVYREYMLPLLGPLSRYEAGPGIPLHPERVRASLKALNRVREDAERRAQASSGWPLKLSQGQKVGRQLFKVEKLG